MIRGLYTTASALLTLLQRQTSISHNLMNVNTVGYKREHLDQLDFSHMLLSNLGAPPQDGIGTLGTGVLAGKPHIDFEQGALQQGDQQLDVAITGDGLFHLQTPDGDRYTRDGRFGLDAQRRIVNPDGYFVLNPAGTPITLPAGDITIGGGGQIFVDGRQTGQIGVVSFADPGQLMRAGDNLFSETAESGAATTLANAQVHQGYLENSNADAAGLMVDMLQVTRAYEAAQRMMQMQDEEVGKAVNEIGKM